MIGNIVKKRMKALNLKQNELAEMAHISSATLSNIINDISMPKKSTLEALAKALQMQTAELQPSEEWNNWPDDFACPRCNSRAVQEFYNHADGSRRIACGFCGLDTGEQKDRATAMRLFASYVPPQASKKQSEAEPSKARVYTITELLDSSACDYDDVRPVWLENQGLFCCPALMQCGVAERERDCVRFVWWNSFGVTSYELKRYGYTWRCWTDKPTGAQSDAVPWLL